MEKHINKIDGSESKLDLTTFLKIRKISIERFLSENNVNSLAALEAFIKHLENSSNFNISDTFKSESIKFFSNKVEGINIEITNTITTSSEELIEDDKETLAATLEKPKKKRTANNNSNTEKE